MNEREYIKGRTRITAGFGSLLCFILFIASCVGSKQSDQTTDSADEKQAIEKTLTEIVEAANAGDIGAVMGYFAEDAVAMPTDEMPVFGTRLIRPRLQALADESQLFVYLTSEEVGVSGNFAFARGYISGRMESKNPAHERYINQNEYLMLLQKDSGGSWKIARLMWHPMISQTDLPS